MGKGFAPAPVALYGVVLLFAGIAYFVLTKSLKNTFSEVIRPAFSTDANNSHTAFPEPIA
jgi:hypothetical protein